jgi:ribosome recycling factor
MDTMIKMLLPMLGLTPEKVKSIIDDLRGTANDYAADISEIRRDLASIKSILDNKENHNG